MEDDNVIKVKREGSYITGIIGAFIGGLIGAIPWILIYVEGNLIVSLLAMFIALGALKGYKIFKGKISTKMRMLIVIISLLIVIVSSFVINPRLLANKYDFTVESVYQNSDIKSALIRDSIVSVLFAILGISVAMSSINKTLIENGLLEEEKEIMKKTEEVQRMKVDSKLNEKEKLEVTQMREIFEGLNAIDRKNAINKNEIISKMTFDDNEKIFKKFNTRGVIVKHKGKYFYDRSKEFFLVKKYWITYFIWIIIIVSVVSIMNVNNNITNTNTNINNTVTTELYHFKDGSFYMEISNDWKEVENNFGNVYMQNLSKQMELLIIDTYKKDIVISLEEYRDLIQEYVGKMYEVENEGVIQECQINGNKAYSLEFDVIYNGRKIKLIAYCVETEKFFLEIYTFSIRSKAEENKIEFLSILNTLEEIKVVE